LNGAEGGNNLDIIIIKLKKINKKHRKNRFNNADGLIFLLNFYIIIKKLG